MTLTSILLQLQRLLAQMMPHSFEISLSSCMKPHLNLLHHVELSLQTQSLSLVAMTMAR